MHKIVANNCISIYIYILPTGCAKIGPSAVCRVATPEQMQCFQQAGAKFSDKLQVQCNGVDLDLLEKEEVWKNLLIV